MMPAPDCLDRSTLVRGRDDVIAELIALVAAAVDGRGGAMTLVGDAGIGKSAVLDVVAAWAAGAPRSCRVVRLVGVEAELEMAWSGLASLLGGVVDGFDGFDRLAPPRAAALRTAFALDPAPELPIERFAVSLATRDLLVDSAEQAPIVIVIDDLQWVDVASRRAISFISRRLPHERIAIVSSRLAGTDEHTDTGPARTLDPVDDSVADAILVDAGVSSHVVRERIVATSGGLPLVLMESANLLDEAQRSGRELPPDPLPIGPSGQRVVDIVLGRLPTHVRTALVVVAAEPDGHLDRVLAALGATGHGPAELEAAEAGGVVVLDRDRVSFRHPLMRSATYHGAPAAERRAAHRALADTASERSTARAWHLAHAAIGPDGAVADALEVAAEATERRAAASVAGRTWELASRLSPEPSERLRRLRMAATAFAEATMHEAVERLLDRAEVMVQDAPDADDPIESVRRAQLRCHLPSSAGGPADPAAALRSAAASIVMSAPEVAADLLIDAIAIDLRSGAFGALSGGIDAVVGLRELVGPECARRIDVVHGARLLGAGDPRGDALFDRSFELAGTGKPEDATFLATVVAPMLAFFRRTATSETLLRDLESDLRSRSAIRQLISILNAQTLANYGRSLPNSIAAASEAVRLATSVGAPELASLSAGLMLFGAAATGDAEAAAQAANLLASVDTVESRALALHGRAFFALCAMRLDESEAHYRQLSELAPIGVGIMRWEPEWVEVLVRMGRRDEASSLADAIEEAVGSGPLAFNAIERVRGMLAVGDDAAAVHFQTCIAASVQAGNQIGEGRTELVWGERLRRARRRGEARTHLARAVTLLREIGATALIERAVLELRAAGGVIDDDVSSHQLLTPHELQVCRLVVGGASNRDLAASLFISPRTVEAHLTSIFRKLGVRNRGELAARAIDDRVLRP